MAIIAVIILILYYYYFVTFEKDIQKPQNLAKPVINLKNETSSGQKLQSDHYYDYDSGLVKGPYEYSIHPTKDEVVFTAYDNEFNKKSWILPLMTNYYWRDGQIVEKDGCFNIPNNSNVKAEGKMLFDYIQNNHLIMDQQIGSVSRKIFHSDRLFYFKCSNNQIESLHSCPPGTILNDRVQCEKIHTCMGKPNNYQFPDNNSKFKYFKCVNEKPHHQTCPSGQIFEYDQCIKPRNLCEVRSDGFLHDLDRKTFLSCVKGKIVVHHCPPYTYNLNGECENEVCENIHDSLVPITTNNGTFEYAAKYGKCKKGRLIETFDCPSNWDPLDTDVNILHLPQVFDPNIRSCTKPVLCENVQITDSDIIIPQYAYAKYLKNWGYSQIFDLVTGYKCAGKRIQETVDPGELIINFRKTKISSNLAEHIPVSDATQYFDVVNDRLENCPPGRFFDGFECKLKSPNAFSFRHLDIFEFDNFHINGWMRPPNVDYAAKNISCTGDFRPMNVVQACVHKDCAHLQFLYQVKGSIKIDDRYECVRNKDRIEKLPYSNPFNFELDFWDQRLTPTPKHICTFGTKVKTGHFVLDSTFYMTCDPKQPFVFCPSKLTETIQLVGTTYACVPKQSVYELIIPKNVNLLLYINEISGIQIPKAANITINSISHFINNPILLDEHEVKQKFHLANVFFYFMCDETVKLYFKKLPTYPENVYLENGVLKLSPAGVYDIIYDRQAPFIESFQYTLKDCVTDFKY